ncbi:MAG: hypothetical protein EBZ29_07570 [Synechococcaceae bacterium WB9_4xC_028]|uniref:hypothetical protein n=1 Tax=Synechococcus sp. CB0101 TaxID=232348 RepID=UPI0002002201|nr:hypothetical protein [Synechococcus sp. CB0101]NDD44929.1 hypothetical protein [Synechococcaceae bacterium WB9_4xB_025]NDD69248.1 hypothetical protein [Synechococcaceae bacterium WB9_4xC_028]QCH14259.1 hypothetical protein CB0101_04360 [Synechococcus sp. CB0101]
MCNKIVDSAALRVAGLWGAWLLLMLFHVELGLMPLFHGVSVEIKSQVAASRLPRIFLAMLLYFLIPVIAMLLALHAVSEPAGWSNTIPWRQAQFLLSVLYSLTNLAHLVADIRIPDSRSDQVVLMLVLTLVGVFLNLETWLWWQG